MKLPNLQELIFFRVASFDADAKPIFFCKVIYLNYLQSECQDSFSNLFQAWNVGLINNLSTRLHSNMISSLYEIIDMP